MDFDALRSFLAVAETLSFTTAAGQMGISQPALSNRIQELERELGVSLFQRSTRRVNLTEAGTVFLPEARRLIAEMDNVKSRFETSLRGGQRPLRFGISRTAIRRRLLRRLARFSRQHDSIDFKHRVDSYWSILDQVKRGILDAACVMTPTPVPTSVASELLTSEILCLIVSRKHALATNIDGPIPLSILAGETLLLLPEHPHEPIQEHFCQTLETQRVPIQKQLVEAPSLTTLLTAVSLGQGVTILPSAILTLCPMDCQIVPLPEMTANRYLIWNAKQAPPLLDALKEALAWGKVPPENAPNT